MPISLQGRLPTTNVKATKKADILIDQNKTNHIIHIFSYIKLYIFIFKINYLQDM